MNRAVGDPVLPTAGSFGPGHVTHCGGAPAGETSCVVRSVDGVRSMKFVGRELAPGPAAPSQEIGDEVVLFGAPGRILARSGDCYAVEVVRRRRSGLEFHHLYPDVPAWVLALGYT